MSPRGTKKTGQPTLSLTSRSATVSAATLSLALLGCEAKKAPPPETLLRPVRTQRVAAASGERVRKLSGVIQAGIASKLSFRVAGTLRGLKIKVGQKVKKGQLLAEVDPKDLRLQVQRALASLAQAKAQQTNAKNSYERARKLYETNTASRSDLDRARAAYASAQAQVAAARQQTQLARSQVGYTKLFAPADGAISIVSAEVNENVQPGQPVAVLSAGGQLEVKVAVPEALIAGIKVSDKATVAVSAVKDRSFEATVTEVGVASEGAASFPVIVRFGKPDPAIRPGMAAEVAFRLGAAKPQTSASAGERLVVPPFAVGGDRGGERFVFVAEAVAGKAGIGVVRRRLVKVGALTAGGLEVTSGLKPGELLVTAGVSRIRDGLEVKLQTKPSGGRR